MTGRIGAMAIRSSAPYTLYLGGAQGGMRTMAYPRPAPGPLKLIQPVHWRLAPLHWPRPMKTSSTLELVKARYRVTVYFGDGVLKSTNGGNTFSKISAAGYFTASSISKIVVHETDPNTLYVGTLRGRGGARRTSSPGAAPYGVYKSTNGGVNWTSVYTVTTDPLAFAGITDLAIDPIHSDTVYATILGVGIIKTTNGGNTWTPIMNGLPTDADYSAAPCRIARALATRHRWPRRRCMPASSITTMLIIITTLMSGSRPDDGQTWTADQHGGD